MPNTPLAGLQKARTGIEGLDEITHGGLPQGRPTLVCGGPGCGKSMLGMEFLIRGATEFNEPGVLMTFEETAEDFAKNVAGLGFDLEKLIRQKKIVIDYVRVDRSEIEENGEYDLEGIFIRLAYAIKAIGAKRVMLDTIESLFSGLSNQAILRSELRRLFGWLKEQGMTTVITAERGEGALTRQGLEEYVSDCVILLDNRVINQITTRRLRVVKYRGSTHGTNEYPFLIDQDGLTVLPITSMTLNHGVSNERVTSGILRLDTMLGGGYYRGSSVLVTGTAGSGKSSIAASLAATAGKVNGKICYFAFEESKEQIQRNMKSIGLDLKTPEKKGDLKFFNQRPTVYGLETHLAVIQKHLKDEKPDVAIFDPVTNLLNAGATTDEVTAMLTRLIDYLKGHNITAFFTTLTTGSDAREATSVGVSSLMDTWILLRDLELNGERNRALYVLKSRGMKHSNQVREFLLTDHGIELQDVYVGPEGVLTGSARLVQEARALAAKVEGDQESQMLLRQLERKRKTLEAQVATLQTEFEAEEERINRTIQQRNSRETVLNHDRQAMARRRWADDTPGRTR